MLLGDVRRNYVLHLPHRPRKGGQNPLLVMLTERGGKPGRFSGRTHITEGASKLGYVLVVPEAQSQGWRHEVCGAGGTPAGDANANAALGTGAKKTSADAAPGADAKKTSADAALGTDGGVESGSDVAFVGALIDELIKRPDVDRRQVYLLGTDAGAALAARAAQAHSAKVAAVALNLSEPVCPNGSWKLASGETGVPALVIRQAGAVSDAAPANEVPESDALGALLRLHECSKSDRPIPKTEDKLAPVAHACKGPPLAGVDVQRSREPWPRRIGPLYSLRVVHQFFERHRR